jgi:hypothetical protein
VKNVFSFLCKLDQNAAIEMLQMSIVDSLSLSSSLLAQCKLEKGLQACELPLSSVCIFLYCLSCSFFYVLLSDLGYKLSVDESCLRI